MKSIEQLISEVAGLASRRHDTEYLMLFRRRLSSINKEHPDLGVRLSHILASAGGVGAARRFNTIDELPKDTDSGLSLLFREEIPTNIPLPILTKQTLSIVLKFVRERKHAHTLRQAGIPAPSSLALVGPPGTGKTSLARWIASELELPFLTLNIAGIVASFLGQTGQNIKKALDRAKIEPSVLLLDEFDSLGYKRGDDQDVGEMKRVVTVLLQEIENWPEESVIIAATNMPEHIDLAFKRRFSRWIEIPIPDTETRIEILKKYFGPHNKNSKHLALAATALQGASGADLQEFVRKVRASEIVEGLTPKEALFQELESELTGRKWESSQDIKSFLEAAHSTDKRYFTLRKLGEIVGKSHTTVSRIINSKPN
jgi:SpoVK/Ycf46/Vps4 family AAA+-type ATPase